MKFSDHVEVSEVLAFQRVLNLIESDKPAPLFYIDITTLQYRFFFKKKKLNMFLPHFFFGGGGKKVGIYYLFPDIVKDAIVC